MDHDSHGDLCPDSFDLKADLAPVKFCTVSWLRILKDIDFTGDM
jgi:hypothetical protein